ncbi:hypothetical protein T10_5732 [Trichinella papuae]|uniref:Uncharacterized protein n=1 Tax=Trichinella papuae TaxID=268474 RepID=A0A0V1MVV9_9BILA|nr:hypothetical protein T10_5732 [Trichinella papuae]
MVMGTAFHESIPAVPGNANIRGHLFHKYWAVRDKTLQNTIGYQSENIGAKNSPNFEKTFFALFWQNKQICNRRNFEILQKTFYFKNGFKGYQSIGKRLGKYNELIHTVPGYVFLKKPRKSILIDGKRLDKYDELIRTVSCRGPCILQRLLQFLMELSIALGTPGNLSAPCNVPLPDRVDLSSRNDNYALLKNLHNLMASVTRYAEPQ